MSGDRANNPAPARDDFTRQSQPATDSGRLSKTSEGRSPREPKPHGACQMCDEPLTWGHRFCSQVCWRAWTVDQRPGPPSPEEFMAEAQAALDALRAEIEGAEA